MQGLFNIFFTIYYVITLVLNVGFQVKLVLDEPEPGVTIVKLTHTDVPEEDRLVVPAFLHIVGRISVGLLGDATVRSI